MSGSVLLMHGILQQGCGTESGSMMLQSGLVGTGPSVPAVLAGAWQLLEGIGLFAASGWVYDQHLGNTSNPHCLPRYIGPCPAPGWGSDESQHMVIRDADCRSQPGEPGRARYPLYSCWHPMYSAPTWWGCTCGCCEDRFNKPTPFALAYHLC